MMAASHVFIRPLSQPDILPCRGHEGAGDFGSDTTLFTVEATVTATRVAQVGAGPEAR